MSQRKLLLRAASIKKKISHASSGEWNNNKISFLKYYQIPIISPRIKLCEWATGKTQESPITGKSCDLFI